MREISMERVEQIRQNIYDTITSVTMTHEQKLTSMCCHADSLMEVIDLPEGLDELLNVPIPEKCICDLNEGHAGNGVIDILADLLHTFHSDLSHIAFSFSVLFIVS